jgi:hypothetical protein
VRPLPRLCLAVIVAVVAAGCGSTSVFSLQAGECFLDAGTGEVTGIDTVGCDEPHDAEAFHTFELAGDELPDAATLHTVIAEECFGAAFEDYIGAPYETSEVEVLPIRPTEESWDAADDREVVCAARIPGERVEGSLQGSGR